MTNAVAGTIQYATPIGEPFNIAGNWTFWVFITDNSLVSIGEPFTIKFYQRVTDMFGFGVYGFVLTVGLHPARDLYFSFHSST